MSKAWSDGQPVTVNRVVWGDEEKAAIEAVFKNDWFGPGQFVGELAAGITDVTGIRYIQPVNSGSSGLLLAVQALKQAGRLPADGLILHPALTFPTSIAPCIQSGYRPVFVDIDPETYQIDLDQAEETSRKYSTAIVGAVLPHILGNIVDMERFSAIMGDRPFIEDCCDTLGGYFDGRHVGAFGDVAATSFYGSHHITSGGVGGATMTNDSRLHDLIVSMTHWGRVRSDHITGTLERFKNRYWYATIGYDMQMTELQAAFAVAQLNRLEAGNALRKVRWSQLNEFFQPHQDWFILPKAGSPKSDPSWFGFPLTVVKEGAPFSRDDMAVYLIENKIEIRPMFTGFIGEHPAYRQYRAYGLDRPVNAIRTGHASFFLPAWGMTAAEMDYQLSVLESFLYQF